MSIIYKTTNILNGKIYIGKAKINDPAYLGSGVILNKAIEKYGRQSFTKEILEECSDNIVNDREIYWIATLNSTDKKIGYNLTHGGSGGDTTTLHPDKEAVIKSRGNSIKQWHNSLSEDEKQQRGKNISDAKKGRSNGHTGLTHSEETKQLIKNNQPAKSVEWKQSHAAAMAKRRNKPFTKKYKPVIVNDIEYASVKHAIDALGLKHRATFYKNLKLGLITVKYK